jgi:AraC-like DNA-binding protein
MDRRRSARFGAYTVSLHQCGPSAVKYTGDNFGHPWRTARLTVVMDGEMTIKAAGATEVLTQRCAALAIGWRPSEVHTEGALLHEVDIAVERSALRGSFDASPLTVWGKDAVLPSATAAALRELVYHQSETPEVRAETNRVVEQLIAGVATCRVTSPKSDLLLEQIERERVVGYVSEHFCEQALTPAKIADHFGVSTRTLHRLFEGEDKSVCGWIAYERLNSALDKLRDPRQATQTLEDIAESCGYGSALALRRAVAAETGHTPSEVRAEAMSR